MLKILILFIIIHTSFSQNIDVCIADGQKNKIIKFNSYVILYSTEARYQFGPSDSPLQVVANENFYSIRSKTNSRYLKFSSDVILKAQKAGNDITVNDHYKESGSIRLSLKSKNNLQITIRKNIEEYIKYVTYHEIFTNKVSDIEAIKAQSVAARTYTLRSIGQYDRFDVYSDTRDQVYRSNVKLPKLLIDAVNETKSEVLTYNNDLILSKYCANLGGSREIPNYIDSDTKNFQHNMNLKEVRNLGKLSKYYRWNFKFTLNEIISRLKDYNVELNIDTLIDNNISFIINDRNNSGRVTDFSIYLNNDELLNLKRLNIRKFFRIRNSILPSNLFYIKRKDYNSIELIGGGHGHGEGMGQWEAIELSRKNYDYRKILSLFYPNTTVSEIKL